MLDGRTLLLAGAVSAGFLGGALPGRAAAALDSVSGAPDSALDPSAQAVFGRIRIRISVPVAGTYRVIRPGLRGRPAIGARMEVLNNGSISGA